MYTESPPLNDDYPEHDVGSAERASSNRVHRLRPGAVPRSSGFKNTQVASDRSSIARRIIRALGRFSLVLLLGVGATLAWQSYGGEMVRAWAPSLSWLVPTSPSAELQALLKPVALDLAIMKRSIEQLAGGQDQLARKQDQDAGFRDTASRRAGHQAEYFSLGPACTQGRPRFAQTGAIPSAVNQPVQGNWMRGSVL